MEKAKLEKKWTETDEGGETSTYTLWSPWPLTMYGEKVARVKIQFGRHDITESVFRRHPDDREYYDNIASPGKEYGAEAWFYVQTDPEGYHLYTSKEARERILKRIDADAIARKLEEKNT